MLVRAGLLALVSTIALGGKAEAQTQTYTTLSASSSTVTADVVITLTAAVKTGSVSGTNTMGPGTVMFCRISATNCTSSNFLGMTQVTSAGTAVLKLRLPYSATSYSLYANYLGTPNAPTATRYTASSSSTTGAVTLTVNAPATPPAPPIAAVYTASGTNPNYTLTDSLYTGLPQAATGTVTFQNQSDGNATIGTANLTPAVNGVGYSPSVKVSSGLPSYNQSVLVGDFNNDGYLDFLAPSANGLAWSVGNGTSTGVFTVTSGALFAKNSVGLVAGDFNNDGSLDFVQATATTIQYYKGNGTAGTSGFTATSVEASGTAIRSVAALDFNRDGFLDLVVVDSGNVYVYINNGNGTFAAKVLVATPANTPYGVAVGDFNGDGYPDVVIGGAGNLTILLNKGDGTTAFTSTTGTVITTGGTSAHLNIAVGDLNNDGFPDIVAPYQDNLAVLLNNGSGGFTATSTSAVGLTATTLVSGVPTAGSGSGVGIFDLDGDGDADVVAGLATGSSIFVFPGTGTATLGTPSTLTTTSVNIANIIFGDFTGGGMPDIIAPGFTSGGLSFFYRGMKSTVSESNVSLPFATSGNQTTVAVSTADAYSAAGSSNTVVLSVGTTSSVTNLTTDASTSATVVLTATVASTTGTGTPTGTVTFSRGSAALTCNSGSGTLASGTATCTVIGQPTGNLTFTASYLGDSTYFPSSSSPVARTVTAASGSSSSALVVTTPPVRNFYAGQNPGFIGISEEDSSGNLIPTNGDTIKLVVTNVNRSAAITLTATTINGTAFFDLSPYPVLPFGTTGTAYAVSYAVSCTSGSCTSSTTPAITNSAVTSVPVYVVRNGGDSTSTGTSANCADNDTSSYAGGDTGCQLRDAVALVNTGATTSIASINFASTVATVAMAPGNNNANALTLSRNVNIAGPGPGALTITNGNKQNIFLTSSSGAQGIFNLSGVTLTGLLTNTAVGGAVQISGGSAIASPPSISFYNVTFSGNNTSGGGGGAIILNSSFTGLATFDYCTFLNNKASGGNGGGLSVAGGAVDVRNSYFGGNSTTAGQGGGLNYNPATLVNITSVALTGQTATFTTTATYAVAVGQTFTTSAFTATALTELNSVSWTVTSITSSTVFAATTAATGLTNIASMASSPGGFFSNLIVENSTFYNNSASTNGGGIYETPNIYYATVTNITIAGNTATGIGGGYYKGSSSIATLNNTIVEANTESSATAGSDVYSVNTTTNLTNNSSVYSFNTKPSPYAALSNANLVVPGTNGQVWSNTNGGTTTTFYLPAYIAVGPGSPALAAGLTTNNVTYTEPTTTSSVFNNLTQTTAVDARGFLHQTNPSSATAEDVGAEQTFLTLAFVTQPQASVTEGSVIDSSTTGPTYPTVQVRESGAALAVGGFTVTAGINPGTLSFSGMNAVAAAATGLATFSNLIPTTPESSTQLTAYTGTGNAILAVNSASFAVATAAALTISASPTSVAAGVPVTLTVTAKDQYGNTATSFPDTVKFTTSDPHATLPANSTLTNGTGTFIVTFGAPGTYTVTVTDTTYATLTATTATISVSKYATALTLSSSNTPSQFGDAVDFTATLSGSDPYFAAAGMVTFYDSGLSIGTVNLTGTNGTYAGVLRTTSLAVGSHTITATFTSSDAFNMGSSSSSFTEVITAATQSIFVVSSTGTVASLNNDATVQSAPTSGGGIGAAVDALGQVWSITTSGAGLTVFTNAGAVAANYAPSGLTNGAAVAIDGAGTVWVVEGGSTNAVFPVKSSGAAVSSTPVAGGGQGNISSPASIAIDTAGSVWIANSGNGTLTEVIGAGAPTVSPAVSATTNGTQGKTP